MKLFEDILDITIDDIDCFVKTNELQDEGDNEDNVWYFQMGMLYERMRLLTLLKSSEESV